MLFFLTYHAKMGCVKITLIGVYLRGSIVKRKVSNDNIAGLPIVTVLPILTLLTRIIG